MSQTVKNWNTIKRLFESVEQNELRDDELINPIHPCRDFGVKETPGFRTVEQFDAQFGCS